MEESLKFFWDSIKGYLDLSGLEEVIRLYPEFREEAERLAAPKRLVSKFMEATAPMCQ